jgi:hypothetical protein
MIRLALTLTLTLLLASVVGVGHVAAAVDPPKADKADVTVVVVPKTTADAAAAGILTYEIIAMNHGTDWARNTMITVPFASTALKLQDVKFSGQPGWVKQIGAGSFTLQIGRLDNGGGMTMATVRFARLPGAAKTAALSERVSYTWDDATRGGSGQSNIPALIMQPIYSLVVEPKAGTQEIVFSSDIFAPGEPLTFWCNHPDGSVEAAGVDGSKVTFEYDDEDPYGEYTRADGEGVLNIAFSQAELHPGHHTMVVYGNWTGFAAVADIMK